MTKIVLEQPETHVVVRFRMNWADEFDVEGLSIWEKEAWELFVKAVESVETLSANFGTNEGWEDEESALFLESCTVIPVTRRVASLLQTAIGGNSFGTFAMTPELLEGVEDNEAVETFFEYIEKENNGTI